MNSWLFLFLVLITSIVRGETTDSLSYPEVGKPMIDLPLRNIAYYSKKQAKVSDFLGKWLVLDFWSKGCGACVMAFPIHNEIQKRLKDKVQVMLVAMQDPDNIIQPMYAKYRERLHLELPCAFDSLIFRRLDLWTMPHVIIIDDKGVVRSVTLSVNVKDMEGFINGTPPKLRQTYLRMSDPDIDMTTAFDGNKPFLLNGNGGKDTDFLFRSVLASWNSNSHKFFDPQNFDESTKSGRFQALGLPLESLYNYAFLGVRSWGSDDTIRYGKYYDLPFLEITDSSLFKYSRKYNLNLFSYSLIRPLIYSTKELLQLAMQKDFEAYFGYKATVEIRKCPYWKLIALPGASKRLHTRGGNPYMGEISERVGFVAKNISISELINGIRGQNSIENRIGNNTNVYVDETNIKSNIDITLDCIMFQIEDVRKALRENGLELVKDEKDMRVVVITDKKAP